MPADQQTNGAHSTLTVAIASHVAGATVTINTAAAIGVANGKQMRVQIGAELFLVTAGMGTTTLTATAAVENTTPLAHSIGDAVVQVLTAGGLANTETLGSGAGVTAHSALTGLTTGDDHTQYQKESEKGAASGYAPLDSGLLVPIANLPTGTTSTTVAIGNDSRFPTSGEKAALAGTSGTPGSGDKYVTNSDSRNTDARTPTAHATTHVGGGSDAVADFIASGASHKSGLVPDPGASSGTTKFLREDASWQVPAGGGGGTSVLDDLSDVAITSPAANQGISYNGSGWVNGAVLPASILTTAGDLLVEHEASYTRITPSSATASSTNAGSASNTFDGNASTFWQSNIAASTPGQWLRHDLGSAQAPDGVRVLSADATLRADQWALQSSPDDVSWTTRYTSATGQTSVADTGQIALTGMPSARYWRITNLGTSGDVNVWRIHELYLYLGVNPYPDRLPVGSDGQPLVVDSAEVLRHSYQALYQTLTDAATITWNVKSGLHAQVTLGGNRTLAAPTNLIAGQTYVLHVVQDGTGSRTLTWNAVFKWPAGTAPTLSTGAGKRDVFVFATDGTNLYCASQALDVR